LFCNAEANAKSPIRIFGLLSANMADIGNRSLKCTAAAR
jgi:hypothetical protein